MMDDVIAFYRGASQWAKDNIPKLVWPTEDTETEVTYKCVNIKRLSIHQNKKSSCDLRMKLIHYVILDF